MIKKTVTIAIQNALHEKSSIDWRSYWSNIYLSVIETLVFQKNTKHSFSHLFDKKAPLTLANFKGMVNNSELNVMLTNTVRNHRFEYFIRNIFRSNDGHGLFNLLIMNISSTYDFPYLGRASYYICGQDSHSVNVPIDKFKYKVPTLRGWITDKSKIKNLLRYCDAAIELRKEFPKNDLSEERILLIGEIEGVNGDDLVKKKYWIEKKKALSDDRYYHFGIGVSGLKLDSALVEKIQKNSVDRYEVDLTDYKVIVFIFQNFSNYIKDIEHATADIKNIFNDSVAQTVPAIYSASECYKAQKEIIDKITDGWHDSVFETLESLRNVIFGEMNEKKFILDVNLSISDENNGELNKNDYRFSFSKLDAMPSLINCGRAYLGGKTITGNKDENIIIESNATGYFLNLPKRAKLKKV